MPKAKCNLTSIQILELVSYCAYNTNYMSLNDEQTDYITGFVDYVFEAFKGRTINLVKEFKNYSKQVN